MKSVQPYFQHPKKTIVRVTWVFCSDGSQGGHREVEVDTNVFPLVCHRVVEGIHQVFNSWCWGNSCSKCTMKLIADFPYSNLETIQTQ